MHAIRPRLVVSRCLEIDACRYNGASIRAPLVAALAGHVDLLPVCPEVEVGLGVPRDPIRIVRDRGEARLVQPSSGRDLTEAMRGFSRAFLGSVGEVDGFLLKSRSPSCGPEAVKVYGAVGDAAPVDRGGRGLFAGAVLRRFPDHPVEHEARLNDPELRDHWLTGLFAGAALRGAREDGGMDALAALHARYALVLHACSPAGERALAHLATGARGRPPAEAWKAYAAAFRRVLRRAPGRERHADVLRRAASSLEPTLAPAERRRLDGLVSEYLAGGRARHVPLRLLREYADRSGDGWLAGQAYLAPYPQSLSEAPPGPER